MTPRRTTIRRIAFVAALAMLLGACDAWPMFRFDASHSGSSPSENKITPANVGGLHELFTARVQGLMRTSPVVANGVVYMTTDLGVQAERGDNSGTLYAFDAAGVTNCSGTPNTCAPLWSAEGIGGMATPAVANGVVYIGTGGGGPPSVLGYVLAFDAAGTVNCSGTPKVCTPVRRYTSRNWVRGGSPLSSVTVAGGNIFVGGDDGVLYAFDAKGVTNCGGTGTIPTCTPLWSSGLDIGGIDRFSSTPAVAKGQLFVGNWDGKVRRYASTATASQCPGPFQNVGRVCRPAWAVQTDSRVTSSPSVSGNLVYAVSSIGTVYAIGLDGHVRWTTSVGYDGDDPKLLYPSTAVADGVLYVPSTIGVTFAFDAAGNTGCTGAAPKVCSPLWQANSTGVRTSPAIAGGLMYTISSDVSGERYASAFDIASCRAAGGVCAPSWSGDLFANSGGWSSPTVANGVVYVGTESVPGIGLRFADLHAFTGA